MKTTINYTIMAKDFERVVVVLILELAAQRSEELNRLRQGLPLLLPASLGIPLVFAWQDGRGNFLFDGGSRQDLQDYAVFHPPKHEHFLKAEVEEQQHKP